MSCSQKKREKSVEEILQDLDPERREEFEEAMRDPIGSARIVREEHRKVILQSLEDLEHAGCKCVERQKNAQLTHCAVAEAFLMLGTGYHKSVVLNMVKGKYEPRIPGVIEVIRKLLKDFQTQGEDFGLEQN